MALPSPGELCNLHDGRPQRGSGVAIGHHHGHGLLQREHILQFGEIPQRVEKSLLDCAGIPEDVLQSIGAKLFQDRMAAGLQRLAVLRLGRRRKQPGQSWVR